MTRTILLFVVWISLQGSMEAQGINWIGPCTDKVFCLNSGSCTEGNVFLVEKATTGCGNPFLNYSYRIDLDNNGSTDIMSTEDTINANFALGTHRVIWRASDNCGNMATCEYLFTIRDCSPPNLLCINGLAQNLDAPFCTANFNAGQFILNLNDNCTPVNQIQMGMRIAGDTAGGFPTAQSMSFDSCDVGIRFMEILVRDGGGLVNSCAVYVLIQDADNECSCDIDADIDFQGCARSAGNLKLNNYFLRATVTEENGQSPPMIWMEQQNVTDSCFSVPVGGLPFGNDYRAVVRAFRNDGPLVGFTTFDLLQISKHILGIESFSTFYQMMAADINNSKSVTTFDIVEGRKVLLGITDTFTWVPSWRFIRPLADPTQLLQWDLVRDTYQISYPNLVQDLSTPGLDFIGVKSGDVNLSAMLGPDAEDRSSEPLVLGLSDRQVRQGERVHSSLQVLEDIRLEGWQMAVEIDPAIWVLEGVEGLASDHYYWDSNTHTLRALWYDPACFDYRAGQHLIQLRLRALQSCRSGDGISLKSDVRFKAEAYPAANGAFRDIVLETVRSSFDATDVVRMFSPRPNPFVSSTEFPVWLAEPETATLAISDITGRVLWQRQTLLEAGYHLLRVQAEDLQVPTGRVLSYRLQVGDVVKSGVIILGKG